MDPAAFDPFFGGIVWTGPQRPVWRVREEGDGVEPVSYGALKRTMMNTLVCNMRPHQMPGELRHSRASTHLLDHKAGARAARTSAEIKAMGVAIYGCRKALEGTDYGPGVGVRLARWRSPESLDPLRAVDTDRRVSKSNPRATSCGGGRKFEREASAPKQGATHI